MEEHEWVQVSFIYGTWIECRCGYRPTSQQEMDAHYQPEGAF
jgi:hypothetical protein